MTIISLAQRHKRANTTQLKLHNDSVHEVFFFFFHFIIIFLSFDKESYHTHDIFNKKKKKIMNKQIKLITAVSNNHE